MRYMQLDQDGLADYLVRPTDTIQAAMERMNRTGNTTLLVVDGEPRNVLIGVIADGDIRRYLVSGGSRGDPCVAATNTTPITLEPSANSELTRRRLDMSPTEVVPLVRGGILLGLIAPEESRREFETTVVIMVGGMGTRLAPLTDDCPKPLLHVGGRPILTRIIDELRLQGFRRLVLTLNYLGHRIVDHYADGAHWDVQIDYVTEKERLGTGGAISIIDPELLTDPFVVMNGDLVHNIDLAAVINLHRRRQWDATMVVRAHSFTLDYGLVDVADDGAFCGMREKPTEERLINAGVYVLNKSTVRHVPNGQYFDLPMLFRRLLRDNAACGTYLYSGRWIDIGTATEYERAQRIFTDEEY